MDTDQLTKLLTVVVSLLQAVCWPLIVLFILIYLGASLRNFIAKMSEISFKAGTSGLEATAKIQQIEAAASLSAAVQKQDEAQGNKEVSTVANVQEIAKLVNQTVTPQSTERLRGASVLWVDDVPANNTYEMYALEALGIHFTIATSTEEALKELQRHKFAAIISDMGRPPDKQAGYTLLEAVKKMNIKIPYIIYARGGNIPENKREARSRGAYDSVSGARELFPTVISALENR